MAFALTSCADILESEKLDVGEAHQFTLDLSKVLETKTRSARTAVPDNATVKALLINTNGNPSIESDILSSSEEQLFLALKKFYSYFSSPSIPNGRYPSVLAVYDGKVSQKSTIGFDDLPIGATVVCAVLVQRQIGVYNNPNSPSSNSKIPIYEYSYGKTPAITLKPGPNATPLQMPALEPIFVVDTNGNGEGNGIDQAPLQLEKVVDYFKNRQITSSPKSIRFITLNSVTHDSTWNIGFASTPNSNNPNTFGDACKQLALVGIDDSKSSFRMENINIEKDATLIVKNAEIQASYNVTIQQGGILRIYNDGKKNSNGGGQENSVSFNKPIIVSKQAFAPIVLERCLVLPKYAPICKVQTDDGNYYTKNELIKNVAGNKLLSQLFRYFNPTSSYTYKITDDGKLLKS